MTDFRQINRLMGTRQEEFKQAQVGDFDDRLDRLMNSVDPYWEDREETEMDIYERQSPVVVVQEDGEVVERTTHTAREPSTDENGEPSHRREGRIVASELLDMGEMDLEPIE